MLQFPLRPSLATAVAIALAGQAFAQTGTVPDFADAVDGHHSVALPFGLPGFRTQLLIDAQAIAPTGAVLNAVSFRCDRSSLPATAGSVPNVTVRISQTSAAVGSMATTFANNITAAETIVFQGTVTLPAHQDGAAGPMPWDIILPFAQPFVFATAQGNLLIDIVADNPAGGGIPEYYLDAVQAGGSATQFGLGGPSPSGDFLNLLVSTGNSLEPRLLSPGNSFQFTTTTFFTSPPGVLAMGLAAPAVPVDLGPLGAPDNNLYISPDVLAAHSWTQSFIGWYSTVTLVVPNTPNVLGALIFAQSAALEPTANPLGLVLSHAAEVRIGDDATPLPMQQLDADDQNAATGTLLDFGFSLVEYGATPIRFEGAFF